MNKGIMLSEISWPNMPIIMKNSGLDFYILDYEHGAFDYKEMRELIMTSKLVGIKCIVRIPNNGRKDIIKIMDMGADGLLLPMTNTKEDIEEVVKYAKYRPIGERGISTTRAHTFYNPPFVLDYQKEANAKTLVFAQFETISGVKNAEEILSVNGVDGFMIGPNDLSDEMGVLGKKSPQEILDVIEKLGKLGKKMNKLTAVITTNKDYLALATKLDYDYLSIGSELNILAKGFKGVKEIEY